MTSNSNHINSQYYNKYSKYFKNYNHTNNKNISSELNISNIKPKNCNTYNTTQKVQKNIKSNKRNQNNIGFNFDHINILGMDLFSDDILLILLIYFLYTEGVKDVYLFIVLILLLLS